MADPATLAPLIDANLVLWAHHRQFDRHESARRWWGQTLSSTPAVGVPWPTTLAFVRVSTHPRALERPLSVERAWATVESWLKRPNVWVPVPTERHQGMLAEALVAGRATGNHTMEAHLATLALEWGLELLTADRDFARYPGLHWRDPLADGLTGRAPPQGRPLRRRRDASGEALAGA